MLSEPSLNPPIPMTATALRNSFCAGSGAALRCLTLLMLLGGLPACSSLGVSRQAFPGGAQSAENTPPGTLEPSYLNWIAARLKAFKKPPTDGLELSQPRWLLSNNGWSWVTCVRFQDQGHRRSYVIYFDAKQIVDNHYAVMSDGCDSQTYTPFDLNTAKLVPQATGTQRPIY